MVDVATAVHIPEFVMVDVAAAVHIPAALLANLPTKHMYSKLHHAGIDSVRFLCEKFLCLRSKFGRGFQPF